MPGNKHIFVTSLTEVTDEAKDQLGDIRWEGNQAYKYVLLQNTTAGGVAVADGDVLAYDAEDGYVNHKVVSDNTDADTKPIGAGVALATVTAAQSLSGVYLWVKIKGVHIAAQTLAGPPSDGDALFLSTADKTLTLATAADDPVVAFAHDASADRIVCDFPF